MNSTEAILCKISPEFKDIYDQREAHRRGFFEHAEMMRDKTEEFLEEISPRIKEGELIEKLYVTSKKYYIDHVDIIIKNINKKTVTIETKDEGKLIHLTTKKSYLRGVSSTRIDKKTLFTALLERDDFKHIIRDYTLNQLI